MFGMATKPQRNWNGASLLARRKQAVDLMLRGGSTEQVSLACGFSRATVNRLHNRYLRGGWHAVEMLGDRPFPSKTRRLTAEQEHAIVEHVCMNPPPNTHGNLSLWTKSTLAYLVRSHIGEDMHASTLSAYVQRWGFIPPRPNRSGFSKAELPMRAWLRDAYPALAAEARGLRAHVHWLHLGVLSTATPMPDRTLHLVCALSNRGQAQWLVLPEAPDEELLTAIILQLHHDVDGNLLLLLPETATTAALQDHPALAEHQAAITLRRFPNWWTTDPSGNRTIG